MSLRTGHSDMEPIIEIRGLKKHFGQLEVLNDIQFSVAAGEVICLIGASGSGKSDTPPGIVWDAGKLERGRPIRCSMAPRMRVVVKVRTR